MEMVYCRGCAKEIHHSATACPQCGASQAGPVAASAQRNPFKLAALGFLYSFGFWILTMFVLGVLAGAFDPGNAEARGEQLGQALGGPLLLVAIAVSVALTIYGKLPGTSKTAATASSVDGAVKPG